MKYVLSTEVGRLAIWDSESMAFVNSMKAYREHLVKSRDVAKLMNEGKIVVWDVGGDGAFDVEVRVNPDEELVGDEEEFVGKKALNIKFKVTASKVYVGSPELVGTAEDKAREDEEVFLLTDVNPGLYEVNIYFVNKTEEDKFVVVLKDAPKNHSFPELMEPPSLG